MIEIVEITGDAERKTAYAIRHEVFCNEQRVDPAEEFDGLDDGCRQYLAQVDSVPLGTARIRDTGGGVVKIERVAVRGVP